ncbi:TIGR00266 family protein [Myxococcota bacterium]|nr:TIGR00266 family protein [Myxococcota bacterium]MBU1898137.1 TIGR00266 family protein [Myxococcota bacterium]
MRHSIEHGPAFAWLRIQLEPGESIEAEAGAMVTRDPALEMSTRLNAGRAAGFFRKVIALFVAILRKLLGGETLFINEFSGPQGGEVVIAPSLSGQIMHRQMRAKDPSVMVQAGSYLASTGTLDAKLRFAGLQGLLSGEGAFYLECQGEGDLFLNAYGGIIEIDVEGEYIVDTGHIVAFDTSLNYDIRAAGDGLKSLFLSGEGLVCHFSGRGKLYIQSRNVGALVGFLRPHLRG